MLPIQRECPDYKPYSYRNYWKSRGKNKKKRNESAFIHFFFYGFGSLKMKIVFFKFHSNSKGFFPRGVLKTQKRLETHHLLQKMLPISPEIRAGFKRSGVR